MTREIKFRIWIPEAKIKYEGDMYYQHDQYLSSFLRRVYDQFQTTHPSYLPFQVEDRLMQYTGISDKNDKEIYEGDILQTEGETGIVRWDELEAGFRVYFEATGNSVAYNYPVSSFHDYEVIGNIYEEKSA